MARSWTMASAICSVHRIPERSMRSLMRFLQAAFDWPAGDRPALGEVLVITHAGAIAVKVLGDRLQGLAFCPEEAALSDALAKPLDDLADLSEQDAQGAIQHPEFGFQAPFSMKDIGGFPQFFQNV